MQNQNKLTINDSFLLKRPEWVCRVCDGLQNWNKKTFGNSYSREVSIMYRTFVSIEFKNARKKFENNTGKGWFMTEKGDLEAPSILLIFIAPCFETIFTVIMRMCYGINSTSTIYNVCIHIRLQSVSHKNFHLNNDQVYITLSYISFQLLLLSVVWKVHKCKEIEEKILFHPRLSDNVKLMM